MKKGIELIEFEREEQIKKHKRTLFNDVRYNNKFQLSDAASLLCIHDLHDFKDPFYNNPPDGWDLELWHKMYDKPYYDRIIIAGALIAAEIDRLINSQ